MFCAKCGTELSDDSQFCRKCGQSLTAGVTPTGAAVTAVAKAKPKLVRPFIVLVVLGFLFVWLVINANQNRSNPNGPNPIQQLVALPHTQAIMNPALIVNATGFSYFKLDVPLGSSNVQIQGTFVASGGSGNDIEAFLLPETDFVNWQNGHGANTYYNSGKVTTGNMNITLPNGGGTFYLVFSNKFSLLSQKVVKVDAKLTYNR